MIWSSQSKGVKRLSLIAGLSAAIYYAVTLDQPNGPPAQTPGHPWENLAINFGNLALEAGLYFLGAWLAVRVIAWVVEGFMHKAPQ